MARTSVTVGFIMHGVVVNIRRRLALRSSGWLIYAFRCHRLTGDSGARAGLIFERWSLSAADGLGIPKGGFVRGHPFRSRSEVPR